MAHKQLVIDDRIPIPGRTLLNLVRRLFNSTKSQATQAIHAGHVTVNRRPVLSTKQVLKPGDLLVVDIPVGRRPVTGKERFSRQLKILFEDQYLAVVEKPAGLLTVPTPRKESNTLLNMLQRRWRESDSTVVACCVHRLDRSVSGLLVFAKRQSIAEDLRNQFEQRKPQRIYIAITHGMIRNPTGTFRSYLATDPKTLHRYSTRDENRGELAISHYTLLHANEDVSVAEVRLETGRRNQIRVHFAETNHPLLGDARYGPQPPPTNIWPHRRIALHAISLGFQHPVTSESLVFKSKLPREFWPFVPRKSV